MEIRHDLALNKSFYLYDKNASNIRYRSLLIASADTEIKNPPPECLISIFGEGKKYIYFSNFCTNEHMRNMGYGRKLLQAVKEYYKGYILYLAVGGFNNCPITNDRLIQFYASEGFKVIERTNYPIMAVEL